MNLTTAMNLTRYLAQETNHVPWKAATTNFYFIDSMFLKSPDYDILKNYLLKLLRRVYAEVVDTDSHNDNENIPLLLKRSEIMGMACHLGHQECISESTKQFQNWVQTPNPDSYNPINPNMRGIVYCSAIQYGTEHEWDFAFERFLKTDVPSEKEILLTSLGCSKEPWLLARYLRRAVAGQHIRKQDIFRVFAAVSTSVVGQKIAFDFLRDNWVDINAYMGSQISNIHSMLKFATSRINTKFELTELKEFVRDANWGNDRPIQQMVEHAYIRVDWMNRNYKTIVKWLQREAGLIETGTA